MDRELQGASANADLLGYVVTTRGEGKTCAHALWLPSHVGTIGPKLVAPRLQSCVYPATIFTPLHGRTLDFVGGVLGYRLVGL